MLGLSAPKCLCGFTSVGLGFLICTNSQLAVSLPSLSLSGSIGYVVYCFCFTGILFCFGRGVGQWITLVFKMGNREYPKSGHSIRFPPSSSVPQGPQWCLYKTCGELRSEGSFTGNLGQVTQWPKGTCGLPDPCLGFSLTAGLHFMVQGRGSSLSSLIVRGSVVGVTLAHSSQVDEFIKSFTQNSSSSHSCHFLS